MKSFCYENKLRKTGLSTIGIILMMVVFFIPNTGFSEDRGKNMELIIDHVMFPTYLSDKFLDLVEETWKERDVGRVFSQPANASFKGVYFQSSSFYVEYLSNVASQPYWSNAVYVVVPKRYWKHYKNPAFVNEHFLIPSFGCGYQLVSPDYPHLNSKIVQTKNVTYDGFVLLISKALEDELLSIGGVQWTLPENGKVQVNEKLLHVHDMAVIDQNSKLVAPILQPNPILREHL